MRDLILVKPSMEYIEEIRSYRQEFLDDGGHFHLVCCFLDEIGLSDA